MTVHALSSGQISAETLYNILGDYDSAVNMLLAAEDTNWHAPATEEPRLPQPPAKRAKTTKPGASSGSSAPGQRMIGVSTDISPAHWKIKST